MAESPILSVDEIVATIRHSTLPTVFVEGPEDMFIFNRIEQAIGGLKAIFFPCGCKETLLSVFRRRAEFTGIRCCFLADKDMWYFSGKPAEFSELIVTEGYSIENDLYSDSNIERILDQEERAQHALMISEVCKWFAFEVDKYNRGLAFVLDHHISRLIPLPGFVCCPVYLGQIGYYEAPTDLIETIRTGYSLAIRGKTLYEILVRITHSPTRQHRKYSYQALRELSVVFGLNGPNISRIRTDIGTRLGINEGLGQMNLV